MNKDLKHRVFNIPQNILDKINHTLKSLGGKHTHGVQRAQKLLTDKTVKYGQLKRIIHDFQTMDKSVDRVKYDLSGGDLMDRWSKQHLQGERDLISNVKDARKRADEIGSISGEGKGDVNGQVGSSVDIQNRIDNLGRNRYNNGNEYSSVSKDALSDGDEFGKGDVNGQVGSLTDIKTRTDVVARNKYNDSKGYPDF